MSGNGSYQERDSEGLAGRVGRSRVITQVKIGSQQDIFQVISIILPWGGESGLVVTSCDHSSPVR